MISHGVLIVLTSSLGNCPVKSRGWPNAGLLLDRRLRRWPNIKPVFGERVVCLPGGPYNSYKEAGFAASRQYIPVYESCAVVRTVNDERTARWCSLAYFEAKLKMTNLEHG